MIDTTLAPEHAAQRLGRVTASRIADVMAKTKTGWGASRQNYRAELVAERLTGTPVSRYVNNEMLWGIEQEEHARNAYEFIAGRDVAPGGFVLHPDFDMAGASPDGLVGLDGLLEIKCPNTSTHIDTLLGDAIDRRYVLQMHWQMLCTGRVWCDFVSYDPRLPHSMQLFIKRVDRDDALAKEITQAVKVFLGEINTIVDELKSKYEPNQEAA
jgi:predicted phage-related endonuclease